LEHGLEITRRAITSQGVIPGSPMVRNSGPRRRI
jgi:hypothetical protein